MTRSWSAHVCILWIAIGLGGSLSRAQQPNSSLVKFVTQDSFAAVIVYPKTVAALPEMDLMPREIIAATAMKEVGFDPLDIEEAILFVELSKPGEMSVDYCAILRFKNEVDASTLFPHLGEGFESKAIDGRKARIAKAPVAPSLLFYDNKTIFFAPEAMIAKVLKPKTQVAPLSVKILEAQPEKTHALAVMVLPPVREAIAEALIGSPPLPPTLEALKQLPELVEKFEIHLNVSAGGGVKVAFTSSSQESAEEVKSMLTSAMVFTEEALLAQLRRGVREDPLQEAAANYAQRMTDHFHRMLAPQAQGKVVTLELKNGLETQVAAMSLGATVLLPAVDAAREAARRQAGANRLKQIALAMHNYHDVFGQFPDQGSKVNDGKPGLSWRVHLLPYLNEQELFSQFHLDEPWDSEHNKKLINKMPAAFRAEGSRHKNKTNYLAPIGEGATLVSGEIRTFRSITDGSSNTVMVVEASDDRAVIWTKPDDYEIDPKDVLADLVGLRQGGFQISFFDGSVRFVSEKVDPKVIMAMFTMAGGEPFNLP